MVDVTKEELIAASGASLVGFKQNATAASTRTVEAKLREAVSVLDYGAVGDGSTDDSDAIDAAIAGALTIGGTLFFPKGFYRVVRTLNIGLQVYTNYQQPIDSMGWEGCSLNAANKATNASKKRLDVVGEAGAVIIGDFTATAPTPIIAYNLDNDTLEETGSIRNLTVITANQFSSGKITPTAYADNNLIGLFTGRGAKIVDKINYYGCGYGHVSLSSYWCTHQNLEAFNCGRGFTFTEMNAGLAQQLNAVNCSVGYVMTGQNAKYAVFGCENCENEVWIPSADSSHFGPAYLEDARTSGGQGAVQFRVGKTADAASDVVHCTFENVLLLRGAGNAKQAFQFRASYVNTYTGCRAYDGPNSVDNVSTGTLINCDFTISRFTSNISSEGSWAPVIGDSWGNYFSTTISTGQFSRNGNVVTAVARVAWSSKGSAGASPLILTLPIPARNASELKQAVTIGDYSGLNTIRPVTANILPDTSLMTFHWVNNSNAWSDLFANQCNTGGELVVSMTYLV